MGAGRSQCRHWVGADTRCRSHDCHHALYRHDDRCVQKHRWRRLVVASQHGNHEPECRRHCDRPLVPTTVYAGTDADGVFQSSDGGATWQPEKTGLTVLTVSSLAVVRSTRQHVYAGTSGGGVFQFMGIIPAFDLEGRANTRRLSTGDQSVVHSSLVGRERHKRRVRVVGAG